MFLEEMKITDAQLRAVERVTILACGTSWHAGAGRQVPDRAARAACRSRSTTDPSTATATRSSRQHRCAVVITQSGETADTLAALREAKQAGRASIAICNVVGSMATRETDGHDLHARRAGDRRGVDQGVHVAAGGAVPPGAPTRARRAATLSLDALEAAHRRPAAAAAAPRAGADASLPSRNQAGAGSTTGPTSCISAAGSTIRSPSKAR